MCKVLPVECLFCTFVYVLLTLFVQHQLDTQNTTLITSFSNYAMIYNYTESSRTGQLSYGEECQILYYGKWKIECQNVTF